MVPFADLKRSFNITSTNPYHDIAYYWSSLSSFIDEDGCAIFMDYCIDIMKQLPLVEQGKYIIYIANRIISIRKR